MIHFHLTSIYTFACHCHITIRKNKNGSLLNITSKVRCEIAKRETFNITKSYICHTRVYIIHFSAFKKAKIQLNPKHCAVCFVLCN